MFTDKTLPVAGSVSVALDVERNLKHVSFDMHPKANLEEVVCSLAEALRLDGGCEDEGRLEARKVILNPPATVVIWEDGTKTVAKARGGDPYLPVLGLMCCALRRLSHNRGRFVDRYEDLLTLMEDLHLTTDEMDMLSDVLWVTASLMRTKGAEAALQPALPEGGERA